MIDSYETAVSRGVALLDRELPDWRTKVDGDKLDMARLDDDVLAQLFGGYLAGLEALGVPLQTTDDVSCGFDAPVEFLEEDASKAYQTLTDEWKLRLKGVSL
jgi:hypothetical protein